VSLPHKRLLPPSLCACSMGGARTLFIAPCFVFAIFITFALCASVGAAQVDASLLLADRGTFAPEPFDRSRPHCELARETTGLCRWPHGDDKHSSVIPV